MTKQQRQVISKFTIDTWNKYITKCPLPHGKMSPLAFRIDGTIFSTARYSSGAVIEGREYSLFSAYLTDGRVVDLLARLDFVKWIAKEIGDRAKRICSGGNAWQQTFSFAVESKCCSGGK